MTTYVSSSYSLSSVMFSYILAQMLRHSPQPCSGTFQLPSYSYIALLSSALSVQHPCHIAWAPVYPLLLSSPNSVDADVDQAMIPPSIFPHDGTHGGYGTWQLVMSGEVFRLHKTCTGGYLLMKAQQSQFI